MTTTTKLPTVYDMAEAMPLEPNGWRAYDLPERTIDGHAQEAETVLVGPSGEYVSVTFGTLPIDLLRAAIRPFRKLPMSEVGAGWAVEAGEAVAAQFGYEGAQYASALLHAMTEDARKQ